MTYRCWVYHETEEPKIVTKEEAETLYNDGWKDSPACFIKLESVGIDKDKVDAGDEEENTKAQQVLDAVEGVKDSLNGALNLELMDKNELEAYAKEHFDVDIDRRKGLKRLVKEIKELTGN